VSGGHRDRDALYHLFNECRFGFTHALRIWESNTRAREQLQVALEIMIDYELKDGSAGAAAALLGDLPIPSTRLRDRVERKSIAEDAATLELGRLKDQLDPTLADRPRALMSFLVALTWAGLHMGLFYVDRYTVYLVGHYQLALVYGVYAVASIVTGIAARDRLLLRAASGVQTQLSATLCYAAMAMVWLIAAPLGMSMQASFAMTLFVGSAMWIIAAVAVDGRMLTWGIGLLLGLLGTLWAPAHAILWIGAAGTVSAATLGILRMRTKATREVTPLSQDLSHMLASRRHE
jgi:serine/threonine-protein kinase